MYVYRCIQYSVLQRIRMYCTYILYHKGERDIQYYIWYPVRKRVHVPSYYLLDHTISQDIWWDNITNTILEMILWMHGVLCTAGVHTYVHTYTLLPTGERGIQYYIQYPVRKRVPVPSYYLLDNTISPHRWDHPVGGVME